LLSSFVGIRIEREKLFSHRDLYLGPYKLEAFRKIMFLHVNKENIREYQFVLYS
jgi:hypothetical protein